MDTYRIPRREVPVRLLLDDGRSLEGAVFTLQTGPSGGSQDVLALLNETGDDFLPFACNRDWFLLNKAGIIWAQLSGAPARECAAEVLSAHHVLARLSLAGGVNVVGTIAIVMPQERSRVLDYLNAAGRFVPLFGDDAVTLVQRRFIVSVRSGEGADKPA
jgi:hypothetical protein